MSKAILLNGTSSSGKTTLSKALQNELDEPYLHFEMDIFWNMVPDHIDATSQNFPNLKIALMRSAVALLDTQHNLIIDLVCADYDKITLNEIIALCSDHDIYTVAVSAELDTLRSREKERGDRKIGLAESQFDGIHTNFDYDFIADTSKFTADQLAHHIKESLGKPRTKSPRLGV